MAAASSHDRLALTWPRKLLFAALTTIVFFAALELMLGLFGVDPVASSPRDPFVGFSKTVPLLELKTDSDGNRILETAPQKLVWFNAQSFPADKPADTRRVFCVGGSTTFGRPFDDSTSYSAWLRELLPAVDSTVRWEVINAGGVSYASYRVASVMEELAQYEPDLFIVYSAQNEFLERRTYQGILEQPRLQRDLSGLLAKTRTWSLMNRAVLSLRGASAEPVNSAHMLPSEVDEMLNHSVGPLDYHRDDDWSLNVVRHYEWNLQRMVAIARDAGAEIVLIAPASNLRDCSPFKSQPLESYSDDQYAEVEEQLALIRLMLDDGNFEVALESTEEVLSGDVRNAAAHYLRGQALFGLGRFEDAERAFRKAVDEDVCPLRATSGINAAIRRVAARNSVPLVDFEGQLAAKSQRELGHRCVGGEYFLDHVHPTIDVHRDVAVWTIATMAEHELAISGALDEEDLDQAEKEIMSRIDTVAQGIAFRNLAKVLHWAGKFQEAVPRARDAKLLIPNDLESRLVLADCLYRLNKPFEAMVEFERLFAIGDYPRAHLPYGELLAERGEFGRAKSQLMKAVLTDDLEDRARAFFILGWVHLELDEYEFAIDALLRADEIYADDPTTLMQLAEAYTRAKQLDAAIETLRRVVALDSNHFDAHLQLSRTYLAQGEIARAKQMIVIARELRPNDPEATKTLDAIEQRKN